MLFHRVNKKVLESSSLNQQILVQGKEMTVRLNSFVEVIPHRIKLK